MMLSNREYENELDDDELPEPQEDLAAMRERKVQEAIERYRREMPDLFKVREKLVKKHSKQ